MKCYSIPKEELFELYIKRKLPSTKICKMFGCHNTTVTRFLKECGIQRRPSGSIRIQIPKGVLINLYVKRGLTAKKIANIYNCCKRTVLIKLHKNNVKLRPSGSPRVHASKTELEKYYIKKRLSSRKIAKILNCHYSTIDKKLKMFGFPLRNRAESHIIYPRKDFSGNLLEKAYLIGFAIGDLRVRMVHPHSETLAIACGSTKTAQVELFKKLFKNYGKVWTKRCKNKINMEAYLNLSFSFLLNKKVENWIFENDDIFCAFLAGFTDAEGSIYISKGQAAYSLGNYDWILLKRIKEKLQELGITCSKLILSNLKGYEGFDGYKSNNDYWQFAINRKRGLLYLFKCLKPYIKHRDKIKAMKNAKENIINRNKKFGNLRMGD